MAKQQKTQQFCLKLNSSYLAANNWDVNIDISEARKSSGTVISLADSQILTWINEINGTNDYDEKAKALKQEIKNARRDGDRQKIRDKYDELYQLQYKKDYLCVIMDKKSHYDRANQGFRVNGVNYRRLLTTINGVKTGTVVYTSVELVDELKKRIENGRNVKKKLVPAKLGAYEALCSSASIPVSWPRDEHSKIPGGIIVIKDCFTKFNADLINIDDSDTTCEPKVKFAPMQEVNNNASDGCSMMMPSLAARWGIELGDKDSEPLSGCNLRCAWTKGMTFPFDYVEWAREKNDGNYIITDVWGDKRDVRDADLIVTEGQLKLWSSYDSWEDYYQKCLDNHYTIRIAKTAPHEVDYIRQLNYQFIQPHKMNDRDIRDLSRPTIDEIKSIKGEDVRKSIVYLAGSGLNDTNVLQSDNAAKALMINPQMIADPYISSRIDRMIQKRIQDAKIGVLDVQGNFQILSGDLVALCQSMFGQEITGVLKAGEVYSQYWMDKNVAKVVCYRAPMSNAHSIRMQKISYNDEAAKWFSHIKTCIIVNAWDTMAMALNGFDFDGDLLFTTNNPVLLRTYEDLPALNCIQYNAEKKEVTEDDVVLSNKLGFGSKIGQITNRITTMTSMMASFPEDSEEYRILKYRTQCGQAQQQAEIDKAKGIISNPMPKSWYVFSENIDQDDDSEEILAKKALYRRICAHKKPYFFMYNYGNMRQEYKKYMDNVEEKSKSIFKMSFQELKNKQNKTEKEQKFIKWALDKVPVDMSESVMNKICWYVEDEFDGFKPTKVGGFQLNWLKSGTDYSQNPNYAKLKFEIGVEYNKYKTLMRAITATKTKSDDGDIYAESMKYMSKDEAKDFINMLPESFRVAIETICPDDIMRCDILLDLCYSTNADKDFVWKLCGDTILNNLLKSNGHCLFYPLRVTDDMDVDDNELFECCGKKYIMNKYYVSEVTEDE